MRDRPPVGDRPDRARPLPGRGGPLRCSGLDLDRQRDGLHHLRQVERFQQTLKRWLRTQPHQPTNLVERQLLDQFVAVDNQQRPQPVLPRPGLHIRVVNTATGELGASWSSTPPATTSPSSHRTPDNSTPNPR
jgi:hypothetical protein